MYVVDTARGGPLYFDAQTGLLLRVGLYEELHEYREVDGVLVPHRLVYSRKGGSTTLVVVTIEHNVSLPDERFAVPAGR